MTTPASRSRLTASRDDNLPCATRLRPRGWGRGRGSLVGDGPMKAWRAAATITLAAISCALGPAVTVAATGELRMTFETEVEAADARVVCTDRLERGHHTPGRRDAGSLRVTPTGADVAFLSIPCEDFCDVGEGLFISLWVKLERDCGTNVRSALSVTSALPNRPRTYTELSSVPLDDDRWTLLSGWHYRDASAGRPLAFTIAVEPGCVLLLDDLVLTRSSLAQPEDRRLPILVDGANLVEGGRPFVLHGVNLYGCSDDERDDTRHQTSAVIEDDYRDIAAAGFNCVRLSLWHKVFRESGGWEWLKIHGLWARRHGLRLLLDMHSPPGGYQSNGYQGTFWSDPEMQQELIDFWVEAARVFRDDPVVAAFDIMNEPKPPEDQDWLSFASRTLAEIRKEGWNRPVIVEASMLVDGWSESSPRLDDAGVIYDVHFYMPWDFCSEGEPPYGQAGRGYGGAVLDAAFLRDHLEMDLLRFGRKHQVPLNCGEFGVSDKALAAGGEAWLADLLSLMNAHGVHRQYFCWCVYGDFGIEPGHFRRYPPDRRDGVLRILREARPPSPGRHPDRSGPRPPPSP